ncbi:MAG TPA: RDD family protein [Candidatus Obscuribacterales bacterium]
MIPGIEGFILGIVVYFALTLWGKFSPVSLRRQLAALIDGLVLAAIAQPIVFMAIQLHGPSSFFSSTYLKEMGVAPGGLPAVVSLLLMMTTLAFFDAWFVWPIPLLLIASAFSKDRLFLPPAVLALAIVSIINAVYHIAGESSKFKGTLGKKIAGIEIVSSKGNRISPLTAALRHLLKAAILLVFFAPAPIQESIPDSWEQPILVVMLVLAMLPSAYCLITQGRQALYDMAARVSISAQAGEQKRLFMASFICFLLIADYLLGMSLAYQLLKKS